MEIGLAALARSKRLCCPAFTPAFLLKSRPHPPADAQGDRIIIRLHLCKKGFQGKKCTKTDGRCGSDAEIALSERVSNANETNTFSAQPQISAAGSRRKSVFVEVHFIVPFLSVAIGL